MKNRSLATRAAGGRGRRRAASLARLLAEDRRRPPPAAVDAQQRHADARRSGSNIQLYTVARVDFHKTVETTGVGRFRQRSGDQRAGAVLRPGVAAAGVARRAGQEGRAAGDGRFARFRRGGQRLSQGARHRADQRASSPTSTRTCSQHNGVAAARSGAGADRRRQRRGRPRRRAAGAGLAERRSADHQGHPGGPAGHARRRR